MNYIDNDTKFICVLNGKVTTERLMNALGHVTAGLVHDLSADAAEFLDYQNDADGFKSTIAKAPYIVLKAKNSNQLATLRAAADDGELPTNTFISAMIGESAEQQLSQTKEAEGDTLDYWAVALYGPAEQLTPLTKKFSLFRLSAGS